MSRLLPAVAAALLLLTACKDEGRERYLAARARHVELVEKKIHPASAEYDPVMEKLRSVPAKSSAHAEAQALLRAIEKGRTLPSRPLATPPAGESATQEACAALARQLGTAQGEARARLMEALQKCRERLEREKAESHSEEGHPH